MIVNNGTRGYSGYCFRCGAREFQAHGQFSIDALQRRKAELEFQKSHRIELPGDFTTKIPEAHAVWLYKAGVGTQVAEFYGFGYSAALQRVILPVWDGDTLLGYTARSTVGAKPKYIERTHPSTVWTSATAVRRTTLPGELYADPPDLVITEDILSAVRVGYSIRSVALMGTTCDASQYARLVPTLRTEADRNGSPIPRVAVWLDGDKAGHLAAPKIARYFALQGVVVRIISTSKDPKNYSNTEIRRLLTSSI